jgi:5-aminopentanamidase
MAASLGAAALFVPTNNGLPEGRFVPETVAAEARRANVARVVENGLWMIRADIAGRRGAMVSRESSEVFAPDGSVVTTAEGFCERLVVADLIASS